MSRRVLITGGATGIGRVIANSFESLGDRIAICDKSLEHIKNLKLEMPKSLIVNADVTQESQMKNLFEEVIIHRDPQSSGNTITAAAFATRVNVIKLGIFGMLHISGENKHHKTTMR